MNLSIKAKLSLIFLGFLGLVSGSVYATSVALESQAANLALIDLAAHQRAEVNVVARSVLRLQTETRQNVYYLDLLKLDQAVKNFGESIHILINGGTIAFQSSGDEVTLAAAADRQIIEILGKIEKRWHAISLATGTLVNGGNDLDKSRAITEIETQIPLIVTQIDKLAILFQEKSSRNLSFLRTIQLTFFLSAVGLLTWGYLLARNNILKPLQKLNEATQQISAGNLDMSIQVNQRDEVGALAASFETMRREVAASREIAHTWAEQLEARVEQRTKELSALLDVSADLSSRLEVESVLRSVVDTARELLAGKVSVLCLVNQAANTLSVASVSGRSDALDRTQAPIRSNLLTDVVDHGMTVSHGACRECPILSETFLDEVIVAPLKIDQKAIGAICVADNMASESMNEDTARVLTFLANSAANALENARLFDKSQTAAALAERERIAAEMHDGLAQTLGYLNLKTDQALSSIELDNTREARDQLEMMQPAIQGAYKTVRQALVGLRDDGIPQNSFQEQLELSVKDFQDKSNMPISLELDETLLEEIEEEEQIQLLRIAQECLTNIRRHSEATQVEVSLNLDGKMISLSISDNGSGFDPAEVAQDGAAHLGLKIMRGRVERVAGSLTIQSQPGRGTQVIARVPHNLVRMKSLP